MEKEKISPLQMAILLYPTILATAILTFPSTLAQYVGNHLWLPPIFASSVGFIIIFIAIKLHNLYPGKTVIQFSEDILGKIPGKVVSLLLIFFYLKSTGVVTRTYSEFVISSFLIKTPIVVVIASMVLLCTICLYCGLEVLARVAQFLFPFFSLPVFFLPILLGTDLKFENLLPLFDVGMIPLMKAGLIESGLFAEFLMISFLLPSLSEPKKAMKYGMFSTFGVMITLFWANLICLLVLGTTTAMKLYPLMNVSRYVSFAGFFDNMESVVMAIWITGAFVKISVFFYVAVLGTAQWLNLSDYRPIVWPLGILVVQLSFWGIPSVMEHSRYTTTIFPFESFAIQIFIPLMLLGIALVKKRKTKK